MTAIGLWFLGLAFVRGKGLWWHTLFTTQILLASDEPRASFKAFFAFQAFFWHPFSDFPWFLMRMLLCCAGWLIIILQKRGQRNLWLLPLHPPVEAGAAHGKRVRQVKRASGGRQTFMALAGALASLATALASWFLQCFPKRCRS